MANDLLLKAKARRRRAEAEAAAASAAAPVADPGLAMPGTANEHPYTPPTMMDNILGALDGAKNLAYQGGVGVNKGILNVFGLPGTIGDVLPPGVMPWMSAMPSGEDLQQIFREDLAPKPQGMAETIVNRVGEEVGSTLVPMGGVTARAVQKGVPAIREAGDWFSRHVFEPAAVDPARFIGKETGGAVAAGTGAGVANTMVDRDTTAGQYADLAGAFGGVGLMSLGDLVLKTLGNVGGAIFQRPAYVDQTVKDAVTDRIVKAAGLDDGNGPADTGQLADIVSAKPVNAPSEVIPGFQETLADRTGNPGIAALEYGRQSGPNAGQFAARRSQNADVVDAVMRAVEPTETPGAFRSALDEERARQLGEAANNSAAASSEFEDYLSRLSPSMVAEERGAAVREGVRNADRTFAEMEDMAWQGTDAEVDPAPLAEAMESTRSGLSLARQDAVADLNPTINIPGRLLEELPEGQPVSIQQLNDMRSTMLKEQRDALSTGDRNRAAAIGDFIDEVNGYLGGDAVPQAVRDQTAAGRHVSRERNERFNRPNDPLAEVLAAREGRPNVPDSAVAKKFVQPDSGQASNIDRILAETDLSSHGRTTRAALRDELLGQLEKADVLSDPEAVDAFLGSYSRVFERFPDLRDEIVAAGQAGARQSDAAMAETELQANVGTPDGEVKGRGPVGKYLEFGDAQSERAITEVLNARDPAAAAEELMGFIGDNAEAAEGARAAFWQKLEREATSADNSNRSMGGKYQWRGDWLKRFLDRPNVAVVAEVFYRGKPEALATIRQYADVLDGIDLRQRAKAPGTSGTAQGVNQVLTPETLQSRFYAYMRGQVSGTYLATSIAAVMARRAVRKAQTEAIDRLTDKVLLNPDEAAILLRENNPANRAALARRAKLWLGNEANTILELINGDEPEEGLKPEGSTDYADIFVNGTDPEKN